MVSRMHDPICPSIDPFVSSVEAYDRFVPRDSAAVPSAFVPHERCSFGGPQWYVQLCILM
ncbi:hypothetical protein MA16_Dca021918 [Dendrobium catenatum]|uniref:Uncharacterized protein n=1 Tax=Dendrobium catenatum TaxID=906689 RepID=A0A2I0VFY5_9ASPA|nr:hypothetical protein MA16_Dca021918 [Dendrobium catenatum]